MYKRWWLACCYSTKTTISWEHKIQINILLKWSACLRKDFGIIGDFFLKSKICLCHKTEQRLFLHITAFVIVTVLQVFCLCFVCQVFNGYESTSNYMLCWSNESIAVVYVTGFLHCECLFSIALCEFVIYSGCNMQSCFSIIINTETFLTSLADFPHYAHLFRQIGIFPAIYAHLNVFGWSGTIGSWKEKRKRKDVIKAERDFSSRS